MKDHATARSRTVPGRFIKIDQNFPDHPKTVGLSDRAFRQLVTAWCSSARTGSDGRITAIQARKWFTPKALEELIEAGFVELEEAPSSRLPRDLTTTSSRVDDDLTTTSSRVVTYLLHDFLDYQMPSQRLAELHEKRVAAGQRGGRAKAQAAQAPSKPLASARPRLDTVSSLEVEVEVEEELTTKATTNYLVPPARETAPPAPDPFLAFWAAYPRKDDKAKARAAWDRVVRSTPPEEVIAGAVRYRDDPNREQAFTKLPASWLNAGSWDNPPLPGRNRGRDPAAEFDAVRRMGQELQAAADANHRHHPPPRLEIAR